MSTALDSRMRELVLGRVPFARVTVVRAQEPTSARPGDGAIVLGDGSIEGFVGGHCAESSVRVAALGALADGKTMLLRVLPDDATAFPEAAGASIVVNPCLSGGALEIFIEPLLPPPLLHLVGTTPISDAVAALAQTLGFDVRRAQPEQGPDGALAVIVSSLGRDEQGSLRAALDAGVGFIGLVASRTRGTAVLAEMSLTEAERARLHTPVGLDIGARTCAEIALSVMAEVVRAVRVEGLRAPSAASPTTLLQVSDPVCGMNVVVEPSTPHLAVYGRDYWFCCTGCQSSYAATSAHGTDSDQD